MGGGRHTDLSNMSFASPSCHLRRFSLGKQCHLVVTSVIIHFINSFLFWGGGGYRNVSHLDFYNWVVFCMARSQETFRCGCLGDVTPEDKRVRASANQPRDATAHFFFFFSTAATGILDKSSCFRSPLSPLRHTAVRRCEEDNINKKKKQKTKAEK